MQFDSTRPIWLQVMGDIESSIVTGVRVPGEKLPGGRELAVIYGINPNTAARVYQELEKSGLCETRRGMGTFVTEDAECIAALRAELARQAVREFINKAGSLGLSKEEADQDERKNVIIKALGAEPSVEPDFFQVEIMEGDILLACSDGLYDEVSDEEIISVIKEKDNMNELAAELVYRANRNGGRDNITVITLEITKEEIDE